MEIKNVEDWKVSVEIFLDSKAEELQLMGYEQATGEDVWKCLVEKVWKGRPDMRIYQVVADIMHLGSSTYLSYLTVQSYKNDDLMTSIAALLNK